MIQDSGLYSNLRKLYPSFKKPEQKVAPDGLDLFHVSAFWAMLKLEGVVGKDKKRYLFQKFDFNEITIGYIVISKMIKI